MVSIFSSGRFPLLFLAVSSVAVFTSVCENPMASRIPSSLVLVSGTDQLVDLGVPWQDSLVVGVLDSHGDPVPGVPVNWRVTSGGGTLNATMSRTDKQGKAAVTVLADTVAGPNTVEATVTGLDPVEFSATALPGPPSTITISPFAFPLQVGETRQLDIRVFDRYGNQITPMFPDLLSSDPDVAAVGPGVVHGVGEGTATITAMYAAIFGTMNVTVMLPSW